MSIGYEIGQPVRAPGDFDVRGDLYVVGELGVSGGLAVPTSGNTFEVDAEGDVVCGGTLTAEQGATVTELTCVNSLTADGDTLRAESGRCYIGAPNSAPEADPANGQITFWLDETNHKLKVKVRYSGGTTKVGEIALSTP